MSKPNINKKLIEESVKNAIDHFMRTVLNANGHADDKCLSGDAANSAKNEAVEMVTNAAEHAYAQVVQEREWYLSAMYEMKKKEMEANPIVRTEEDIQRLLEESEDIRDVIKEVFGE